MLIKKYVSLICAIAILCFILVMGQIRLREISSNLCEISNSVKQISTDVEQIKAQLDANSRSIYEIEPYTGYTCKEGEKQIEFTVSGGGKDANAFFDFLSDPNNEIIKMFHFLEPIDGFSHTIIIIYRQAVMLPLIDM